MWSVVSGVHKFVGGAERGERRGRVPTGAMEDHQSRGPLGEIVVVGGDVSGGKRQTWSGRLDFVMSAISFAVGMGNLWRFPYLCYRNGGGAFLIPYVVCMILLGYPLMFLELALGQFASKGIVSMWEACPIFVGIGWGMFAVSVYTTIYYNVIVAWCFFYMFASFAKELPWKSCGNYWNTKACTTFETLIVVKNCTRHNGTWHNSTCFTEADVGSALYGEMKNASAGLKRLSASDEYFNNYMLDVSEGFHDMGGPRWGLTLCFLFAWLIVIVALAKGIQVSGKVTYITALLPYGVLLILLVRGLTLDGSVDGILYYVTPKWEMLLSAKVWGDAAVQVFFSLSLCWGGLITLASYNKFNNNCLADAIIVASGDMFTSVFGGFAIFAILGNMAHSLDVPVSEVATQGPGLAFVAYPEALTKLPVSPLWAVLFMLMLINIGIGSVMGLVSTIQQTLLDVFGATLRKGTRPFGLLLAIGAACFLLGLSMTTRGGVYMLLLMDTYSATYALLILDLSLCIAIGWVYGIEQFYTDMEGMLGFRLSWWWMVCWRFIDPALIMFILVFIFVEFDKSTYRDYEFPLHWETIGWLISLSCMLCVPACAVYKVCTTHKTKPLRQRIDALCKPTAAWGPKRDDLRASDGQTADTLLKPSR